MLVRWPAIGWTGIDIRRLGLRRPGCPEASSIQRYWICMPVVADRRPRRVQAGGATIIGVAYFFWKASSLLRAYEIPSKNPRMEGMKVQQNRK
jgi:hypothetical protein